MNNIVSDSDVYQILSRMPGVTRLFWGIARLVVVLIIAMLLWRRTGLENWCTGTIKISAEYIVDRIEAPGITIMKNYAVSMKKQIHVGLSSEVYFNILLPSVIIFLFPVKLLKNSLPAIVVATLLMIVFDILQTVVLSYMRYYKIVNMTTGSAYLLGISYSIAPVSSIVISHYLINSIKRLLPAGAMKSKNCGADIDQNREKYKVAHETIGRNDPCSCGSGLKYKKCCGV
jgi:hypothetical protein